ncbi:MAG: hypothetical protein C4536_09395 [Actinobacteria bacterium]|nr:MAG: hypothetical protein C4536_09395 [Actinomycetota bacterium]
MKKALVTAVLALLIVSVMVAAIGCGDSGGSDGNKDEQPLNRTANGEENSEELLAVGTYESAEGTSIVLMADGTFKTDAWEVTEGTYEFTEDQEGYWWVELTFKDGSLAVLSVIISMDEVAAIVDDLTMVQYTRK